MLHSRLARAVKKYVHFRLAPQADQADDIVQDVFLAAWENLRVYRGSSSLQASSLMPAGMALSNDGRYLYVRNGGNQSISGFLIHADGSLTPVTQVSGLPDTAAGIAAR